MKEAMDGLVLWLAQGFGVGRCPFGPGTLGSLVGLLWMGVLLQTGSWWAYLAGAALGVALSVWACGRAEIILKQSDPPSVVLDEMVAVPFCYVPVILHSQLLDRTWPTLEALFQPSVWPATLAVLAAFRVFDIAKPWPIRQSQQLKGGWGVTVDDVLAAVYTAVLGGGVLWLSSLRSAS